MMWRCAVFACVEGRNCSSATERNICDEEMEQKFTLQSAVNWPTAELVSEVSVTCSDQQRADSPLKLVGLGLSCCGPLHDII